MHDSLTPLGGLVPLAQMMINCVFGGDGVGLINLLQYAILTVFLADRKSTRLNSSHLVISYAVFCLKKKKILSEETSIANYPDQSVPSASRIAEDSVLRR